MVNREKGEVSLTVDGKAYTLVLNTDTMIRLEDLFSTPTKQATWDDVWGNILRGSIRYIRALVWAMLQAHHPEVTLAATSAMIDRVGGIDGLSTVLVAATSSATPDPEDVAVLKESAPADRPRKAQAKRRGTGDTSIAKLAS